MRRSSLASDAGPGGCSGTVHGAPQGKALSLVIAIAAKARVVPCDLAHGGELVSCLRTTPPVADRSNVVENAVRVAFTAGKRREPENIGGLCGSRPSSRGLQIVPGEVDTAAQLHQRVPFRIYGYMPSGWADPTVLSGGQVAGNGVAGIRQAHGGRPVVITARNRSILGFGPGSGRSVVEIPGHPGLVSDPNLPVILPVSWVREIGVGSKPNGIDLGQVPILVPDPDVDRQVERLEGR